LPEFLQETDLKDPALPRLPGAELTDGTGRVSVLPSCLILAGALITVREFTGETMLHLDWVRELFFIMGISVGTCVLAVIYSALENVIPFLRGGLGRMN
jgi:hypothetical protein